jgi:hypothetical protein
MTAQKAGEQHAQAPALSVLRRRAVRFLYKQATSPQSTLGAGFPLQILRVLGGTGLMHVLAKLRIHSWPPVVHRYQCLLYFVVKFNQTPGPNRR